MPTMPRPGRRPATKPAAAAELVDWRADERVRRLDERAADLARQAEQAAADLEAAMGAREAGQAAHAVAETAYLRGEAAERPPVPADPVPEAQRRVAELARERAQLAALRPGVEAQAKAVACEAVLEVLRPAVARLLATLGAAHAANTAVADLWVTARAAGVDVPSFAWRPLLSSDVPAAAAHFADRDLVGWQRAAAAFVAAKARK